MRPKTALIVCGTVLILALSVPMTVWAFARESRNAAKGLFNGGAAIVSAFFEHKTNIAITENVVSITPISEIALINQTVRVTHVYKRSWLSSECVVVCEQEFVIKYGYDTQDVFRIVRSRRGAGGDITVPTPKILSVEPCSGSPTVLYEANGSWNSISPSDVRQINEQLYAKVRNDNQVAQFRNSLKGMIYTQLKAFQAQIDTLH